MSKQIVITGMHRSGTSLVSSLIQQAGINIGDRLQGASKGNMRGHFEDSDFYNFHEAMLKRRGETFLVQSPNFAAIRIEADELVTAQALIEQRRDKLVWGWKDPRTSLFLDFWNDLLPDPYYVFLYRHPIEIALSLLRRGTDLLVLLDPAAALRSWQIYNQNILNFYQKYPERCLLCHITPITENIDAFISLLARRSGLTLQIDGLQSVYHPDELQQGFSVPEVDVILDKVAPQILNLYNRLEAQADLPDTSPSKKTDAARAIEAQPAALNSSAAALPERKSAQISALRETAGQISSLKEIIASFAGYQQFDQETADYLFFSLLQILDPHAVAIASLALRKHFAMLQNRLADQTRREQQQAIHLQQWQMQSEQLTSQLNDIYRTRAWRFAQMYWSAKKSVQYRIRGLSSNRAPLVLPETAPSQLSPSSFSSTPSSLVLPRTGEYDIICFPLIDWEFRFQRPQQLLSRFAEHGHRVFYLRTRFNDMRTVPDMTLTMIAPLIYGLNIPGSPSLNIYQDQLNETVLTACVQAFEKFRQMYDIDKAVCLVNLPFWGPLARVLRDRYGWKIIYDCMDEHSGFSNSSSLITQMERQLIDYSDLVVVTAKRLYDKLEAVQPVLIPNGADYDHFSQLPAPGSLKQFTRPIVGYYGAISDWFDAGTVAYAASQRADWTFVLIGSTLGANIKVLESQSNIHLLGERPYSVLPAYLADFDVCTIPFLRTPLTEATHPVKFFEYISSGKPVVAKVLPELEPYADIAYLYETREEFLGCLETALAERDDTLVERRRAVARQNRWDDRYTAMATAIRNLYGCSSSL